MCLLLFLLLLLPVANKNLLCCCQSVCVYISFKRGTDAVGVAVLLSLGLLTGVLLPLRFLMRNAMAMIANYLLRSLNRHRCRWLLLLMLLLLLLL